MISFSQHSRGILTAMCTSYSVIACKCYMNVLSLLVKWCM